MSEESLRTAQQSIEEAIKSLLEPRGLKLEKPLRWSRFPKTTLFIVEGRVRGRDLSWSISEENLLAYSTSAEIRDSVDAYFRKVLFGV
ncbi:MAG TPA: hypothetical protein VFO34_11710 [Candidatus Acidoferrales bacterium]|nr:hypothetical protein [Candidatus Acidoferrales bacterium]